MCKSFYVYILASDRNGTIYTGVTSNFLQRVWQYKEKVVEGFTRQYSIEKLVWYEQHETTESAITREKRIKKRNRESKMTLIEESNPYWNDLYLTFTA